MVHKNNELQRELNNKVLKMAEVDFKTFSKQKVDSELRENLKRSSIQSSQQNEPSKVSGYRDKNACLVSLLLMKEEDLK